MPSILATAGQARRRRFVNALHHERVDYLDGGVSVLSVDFLELADAFAQAHVLHAVLGGTARPAEEQFVDGDFQYLGERDQRFRLGPPKRLDMKLAMKIAESWAAASANRPEVELSHALMCLVLLLRGAEGYRRTNRPPDLAAEFERDWSRLAGDLLAQIASRAIRSLHSEILATRWLKAAGDEEQRFRALRTTFHEPLDANDVETIRRFYRFAELAGWAAKKPRGRLIADACRRVTGQAERDDRFQSKAELLERIIRIGDAFAAPNPHNRKMHSGYLVQIEWMIGRLMANKYDITLLMPIEVAEVRPKQTTWIELRSP